MKIKPSMSPLGIAAIVTVLMVPSAMTWAMKTHHAPQCTGKGWHMVSVKCDIKPAQNWKEYNSGVYTQPITGKTMFDLR